MALNSDKYACGVHDECAYGAYDKLRQRNVPRHSLAYSPSKPRALKNTGS